MPVRVFTIPFDPHLEVFQDEEFQKFLLNKQINVLRPEFFRIRDKAYWSVFVEYDVVDRTRSNPIPKELNEQQRLLFQRLREWRKETAEAEKVPVFIIATDRELAQIILHAPHTFEALRSIKGCGKKKTERYGKALIDLIKAFHDPGSLALRGENYGGRKPAAESEAAKPAM